MTATEEKNGVAPTTDALKKEIDELNGILEERMLKREHSLQVGFKVRIGLIIFAFCYCAFLYSLAHSFTADQACLMVRGQLDAQLPTMKVEAIESMKSSAPAVVEEQCKSLVGSIPSWRRSLQDQILVDTGKNIKEIEDGLNHMCSELLKESKAELDKMGDKMTTAQKVERLSKEMKVKLFEDSREIVDGVAEEYSAKIREVDQEIRHLQTAGNLTAKEKHQKEMLRISSKLMQMKLKDVNKDFQKAIDDISKAK